MCGIAGFVGKKKINQHLIDQALHSMRRRGPDNQSFKKKIINKKKNINSVLLSSRLSIIDLNKRSNQPFSKHNLLISFNGEVYNYRELRNSLKESGYKFNTKSDTEVILSGYHKYGLNFFKMMRGMWALAIIDRKNEKVILSRDRFGEKPLYYFKEDDNFYFGSQINQISILSEKKFKINSKQICNYLCLGYRSLSKFGHEFFKNIKSVNQGSFVIFEKNKILRKKYWKLNYKPQKKNYSKDFIKDIRLKVISAVKRNVTSDVPVSLSLSGGIDSNIILSVVSKILKKKIMTFSIVDKDKRYDESELINISLRYNKVKNHKIYLSKIKLEDFVKDLKKQINFNSKPLYTITSYVSNKLHQKIKQKGYKVSLTGVGADELFAGYYDHGLYFLKEQKKIKFKNELRFWKKNILKYIRNPHLKNFNKFLKHDYYTDHIFFTNQNLRDIMKIKNYSKFSDKKFCIDKLRNRMLNQLFYETVPTILNEDDQNHMYSSVENRSPYLDSDLAESSFKIPTEFLIKNSKSKYILREAFKDILPKKIFSNKIKIGFNASLNSLLYRDKKSFDNFFSNQNKKIYEFINFDKLKRIYLKKKLTNSESMFLFRFINCSIFLDRFSL